MKLSGGWTKIARVSYHARDIRLCLSCGISRCWLEETDLRAFSREITEAAIVDAERLDSYGSVVQKLAVILTF